MTSSESIHDALVLPYLNHAVRTFESGYASAADIDAAMRFGCGYPAGPLETVDAIGVGQVRDLLAARFAVSGDPLHRPAALLERLAREGRSLADEAAAGGPAPEPRLRHDVRRVGVVGTGTMATGIVQVFAQAGHPVVVIGRSQDRVDGVLSQLAAGLDRAVAKGRATEAERQDVLDRVSGACDRAALADVDLVVEAVAEDLEVKLALFGDLDRIAKPGAILATTTSSLSVTRLGEATGRPQDVIGMHFFNPAPAMRLVEVITTSATSAEVHETVRALTARLGKVAVSAGDRPGFIVNLLLFPYLNDAVRLLEAGEDLAAVDAAMKDLAGVPMGPFELLDVVGLDVSLAIQEELYAEFGVAGLEPAKTLQVKVEEGDLGRKTGRGFREHAQ